MPRHHPRPKFSLLFTRTTTGQSLSLRHQLGFIFYAWTFGSFWLWTISGAAMTQFSRQMGVPDYGFGVLATLPFAGTLLQVPASYLLEKYGRSKSSFFMLAGLGRIMWTVTAMIPWLLPNSREWWWPTMALSLLFTWSCAQATVPGWMNWMSDVIPRRIRGRYFGLRNQIGQPIGLIATLGIGYALDQAAIVQETRPDIMLHVTSAILAVAGLMGTLDILCFRFVDDKQAKQEPNGDGLAGMMLRPLREAEFRRYLMFNFMMTLSIACIGQYIWLYLFDVVGWSNQRANMMLIAGGLSVVDTIGWLLVSPDGYVLGYSLVLLAVFAWPGIEVANFNFILNLAGGGRGKERNGGAAYVAINSIAIGMGGILSGLLGAVVAKTLGGWTYDLKAMDLHLTYHSVLLLASAGIKAFSLLWVLGLHEPQAVGTRDAIRYMTTSMYSNVRQAVLMPTRIVGQAARWSYQINTRSRRR